TAGDRLMHMCYAFEFLSGPRLTAQRAAEVLRRFDQAAPDGWACWAFSNHDVARHASRWELTENQKRLLAILLLSLKGSVCLYQGEELGLPEAEVEFADLQDPYGKRFWPEFKGRDGCRTPMPWESNRLNAGFSDGKPWLPTSPDHHALAVDAQEGDEDALLAHYRRVIRLRSQHPALADGDLTDLRVDGEVLSFVRSDGQDEILCAFNMGDAPVPLRPSPGDWTAVMGDLDHLAPWAATLLSRRRT
ncbi:MAG: alpha-amylase family glycosyl hydrolase, partial [Pseudomonadota bacterium]